MFSVPQYNSSELQQHNYFVMQEPVFEEKIEEPVFMHVYEENGVLYCASSTSQGVYWYTYALNNPLTFSDPSGYYVNPIVASDQGVLNWLGRSLHSSTSRVRTPTAGPSFGDLYTWVEGTGSNGMWVSNSNYTQHGTNLQGALLELDMYYGGAELEFFAGGTGLDLGYFGGFESSLFHYNYTTGIYYIPHSAKEINPLDILTGKIDWYGSNTTSGAGAGWELIASTLGAATSELYYSERYGTWMGKNFKIYNQAWGGNVYTGGKNKFAKTTHNAIKWTGRALGAWNAYSISEQRRSGNISNMQWTLEQGSNAYSTLGGIYGAAWGIGWELGRSITNTSWYQETKFNFWYRRWERKIGPPTRSNESYWIYFYSNYRP